MKAREEEERQFKIIILGAGECGKSTILKQLRMIFAVLVQTTWMLREAANAYSHITLHRALRDSDTSTSQTYRDYLKHHYDLSNLIL